MATIEMFEEQQKRLYNYNDIVELDGMFYLKNHPERLFSDKEEVKKVIDFINDLGDF